LWPTGAIPNIAISVDNACSVHETSHDGVLMRGARALFLLAALLLAPAYGSAHAETPAAADLVRADLLGEPNAVAPGQTFWIAVRLRMKEHWHTYWRNPGDSGEATAITWQLPPGFSAGPIAWPMPHRIPVGPLANYGYDDEVVLLTQITAPASLAPGTKTTFAANVTWLVCNKECIPGEANLSLTLPAAATADINPDMHALFEAARSVLPQPSPWTARMDVADDTLTLHADAKDLDAKTIRSALFFPFSETLIRHAEPQVLEVGRSGLSLQLARSALTTGTPTQRDGLLIVEEVIGTGTARHAFELHDVALGTVGSPISVSAVLQAAAFALLGGLLLNLMPCVFPVLSIKVLSLISHAGQSPEHVRKHGFAYTAGVLATFVVLAGTLLIIRAGGAEVGWGFQLQSPLMVAALAYVLFAMGLSLSGVFHVGYALQGIGAGLTQRSGLIGSFFTGALAVIVATPCTAPFMGAALGFALTQPAAVSLVVFLALGLGLALPFLLLTLVPRWIAYLPRPGAWMQRLQQALAFPLYATVAWLMWVLGQQVGPSGLFAALIGLVLIGLAAWSFNVWQTTEGWGRRIAAGVAIAALAATLIAAVGLDRDRTTLASASSLPAGVEPFTQSRLDQLRADKRPVFVNMTAAWCITCLVNERVALSTQAVKAAFSAGDIAYLKGDWTNRNPEITRMLERYGRSGVPLYLLYPGSGEPVVLPQILTAATVLKEIERIRDQGLERKASLTMPTKEHMP
jgi:thiol:disulfide interchange protein/DsbC/DsbD-like thiol-disulfide interchange protein